MTNNNHHTYVVYGNRKIEYFAPTKFHSISTIHRTPDVLNLSTDNLLALQGATMAYNGMVNGELVTSYRSNEQLHETVTADGLIG